MQLALRVGISQWRIMSQHRAVHFFCNAFSRGKDRDTILLAKYNQEQVDHWQLKEKARLQRSGSSYKVCSSWTPWERTCADFSSAHSKYFSKACSLSVNVTEKSKPDGSHGNSQACALQPVRGHNVHAQRLLIVQLSAREELSRRH